MPDLPVRRFRFLPPGLSAGNLYRSFRQPRPIMVAEDAVAESEPPTPHELRIVAKLPAGPALRVKSGDAEVQWRPGTASVTAPPELREDLVAALVEFTHYEAELRRMEAALAETLPEAERDTEFAYQIGPRDGVHRTRVTQRMTFYAKLRLEFAQLEFFLHTPCGELSPVGRRWLKALFRKADVEARAEAFGDQLELREELYEGAADRFSDHAGWARGHTLEVIIVVLLVLEFLVMAADLFVHVRDATGHAD